jgi:hypothetical protein
MNVKRIKALTEKIDGKMVAIASTETVDRVGDSLKIADWDFINFKKNPVLLAGHDYRPQYVVGVAKNIRIDQDHRVIFEPVFHEITELASQIKQMFEEGYLKAWSVGYIPGDTNELLEVSAVAVPANAEALMLSVKSLDGEQKKELESKLKEFVDSENKNEIIEEKGKKAKEGDDCTLDDGSEGEMIMDKESGKLVCKIKKTEKKSEEVKVEQTEIENVEKDIIVNVGEESKEEVVEETTVAEELDEQEKMKQKYENLNKVDNIFYAFYKVYVDSNTAVEKFSELVKELSTLLMNLAGENDVVIKGLLTDFSGGLNDILELTTKEGKVISGKNRTLINNCVDALKNSTTELEKLLEATDTSKALDTPDPVIHPKVESTRKTLKNSIPESKGELTVRLLREMNKLSSYGLNKLKK